MSLAIVGAAPVIGMGIGCFVAFSAMGSNVLNIPEWAWIGFCTSLFVATPALAYSKQARRRYRAILVYPAVLCSLAAFGVIPALLGPDTDLGPMAEAMEKTAPLVGSMLIGVIPLMVAIALLCLSWPDITAKPPTENSGNK